MVLVKYSGRLIAGILLVLCLVVFRSVHADDGALIDRGWSLITAGSVAEGMALLKKSAAGEPSAWEDVLEVTKLLTLTDNQSYPIEAKDAAEVTIPLMDHPKAKIRQLALITYGALALRSGHSLLAHKAAAKIRENRPEADSRTSPSAIIAAFIEAVALALDSDAQAAYQFLLKKLDRKHDNSVARTLTVFAPNAFSPLYADQKKLAFVLGLKEFDAPKAAVGIRKEPYRDLEGNLVLPGEQPPVSASGNSQTSAETSIEKRAKKSARRPTGRLVKPKHKTAPGPGQGQLVYNCRFDQNPYFSGRLKLDVDPASKSIDIESDDDLGTGESRRIKQVDLTKKRLFFRIEEQANGFVESVETYGLNRATGKLVASLVYLDERGKVSGRGPIGSGRCEHVLTDAKTAGVTGPLIRPADQAGSGLEDRWLAIPGIEPFPEEVPVLKKLAQSKEPSQELIDLLANVRFKIGNKLLDYASSLKMPDDGASADLALAYLENATELDPTQARHWAALSGALLQARTDSGVVLAIAAAKRALDLDKNDALSRIAMATALLRRKYFSDAITHYEAAFIRDPDVATGSAIVLLCSTYLRGGLVEEGLQFLAVWGRMNGANANAGFCRAILGRHVGQGELAQEILLKIEKGELGGGKEEAAYARRLWTIWMKEDLAP